MTSRYFADVDSPMTRFLNKLNIDLEDAIDEEQSTT